MKTQAPTVLVVDDNQQMRELIAFDFESSGFTVFSAASVEDAIAIFRREKILAVVTDLRLPGKSGVELFRELRPSHQASHTPVVVFVTGYQEVPVDEAFAQGVEGYFTKPFGRRVIVNHVKRFLATPTERWKVGAIKSVKPPVISLKVTLNNYEESKEKGLFEIGRGGLWVALEQDFPKPGEEVNLDIHFNSGALLLLQGRALVRWIQPDSSAVRKTGMGLEFIELNPESIAQVVALEAASPMTAFIPMR